MKAEDKRRKGNKRNWGEGKEENEGRGDKKKRK